MNFYFVDGNQKLCLHIIWSSCITSVYPVMHIIFLISFSYSFFKFISVAHDQLIPQCVWNMCAINVAVHCFLHFIIAAVDILAKFREITSRGSWDIVFTRDGQPKTWSCQPWLSLGKALKYSKEATYCNIVVWIQPKKKAFKYMTLTPTRYCSTIVYNSFCPALKQRLTYCISDQTVKFGSVDQILIKILFLHNLILALNVIRNIF